MHSFTYVRINDDHNENFVTGKMWGYLRRTKANKTTTKKTDWINVAVASRTAMLSHPQFFITLYTVLYLHFVQRIFQTATAFRTNSDERRANSCWCCLSV